MAAPTGFVPTAVSLPASVTAPPTLQFVPPPECNDPSNNWIVTTSCYLNLPHTIAYPEWLTCSISHFGAPSWYDPSCHVPLPTESPSYLDAPKVTVDGVVSYYSGCPAGYSTTRTTTYPGYYTWDYEDVHFDATAYSVQCCPTQYNFQLNTADLDSRQETSTLHDGVNYPLFIYPFPACAATSIQQLSGKEIPVQTWSNNMAWDRRRQVQTISWDYEHGTMFAHQQYFTYTVFHGTHTCFEYCADWFTYCKRTHFPNGEGGTPGPWPTSTEEEVTPTPTLGPEPTLTPEPEPTSEPQPTSEPEPTSEPTSTSEPEPTSDSPPPGDSSDVTPPVETPSQSAPGSETDTPTISSAPSPSDSGTSSSSSSSPSSTIPAGGSDNGTSTGTPAPISGAIGAMAPSLSAALMIGVAVMML